ncbi:MAG TPA: hypothetical protein VEU62_21830 [Bryobacterales bacterium]|nr:hypothetical protein [Bryobacterales bacterium]
MRLGMAAQPAREPEASGPPAGPWRAWVGTAAFLSAAVLAVGVALLAGDLLDLTWPVWPLLVAGVVIFGIARRVGGRPGKAVAAVALPVTVALLGVLLLKLLFNLCNPQVKWLLAAENSMGYAWERCCALEPPPGVPRAAAQSLVDSAQALREEQKQYYRELFRAVDTEVRYGVQAEVSRRLARNWAAAAADPPPPREAALSRHAWSVLAGRFCQALGVQGPGMRSAGSRFFRSLAELGVERLPAPASAAPSPREAVLRARREFRTEWDARRLEEQLHEMSEELDRGN